ncbi:MAG: 2Fe-2S iron-sulfur cluster binding domain-containing protein [Magnetococcales bacterium]|nr:2Fe-2S iron-sulfur cluster binding domain-containing protein [Magnetococcales bacterium]
MTTLELFLYILLGILLQVLILVLSAFHRHWQHYQILCKQTVDIKPLPIAMEKTTTPAWEGFRPFRVMRKIYENSDRTICSFNLQPEDKNPLTEFEPGQYLTFQIPTIDRPLLRCYSLSDRPGLDHYRVTIKRLPDGRGSNHFHQHVHEGDIVQVKAPAGHFFLESGNHPVVLIAGGIGITPMIAMLNTALDQKQPREIRLFYGVRNSGEQAMKAHLEILAQRHPNFHLHVCYSKPLAQDLLGRDYHHPGHVDITLLRLTLPLRPYHFYVCGPAAMMASLLPAMDAWGIPPDRIHQENFGPASLAKPVPAKPVVETGPTPLITFQNSNKTLPWDASCDSLLSFAENNRIPMDSGCRAGACGTCQTVIASGEVDYDQPPKFSTSPGSCLPCICRPKRDLTLLA